MASDDYRTNDQRHAAVQAFVDASVSHSVDLTWLRDFKLETLEDLADLLATEELQRVRQLGYLGGPDADAYARAVSGIAVGLVWSYSGISSDDILNVIINAVRNAYEVGVRDASTQALGMGAQRAISASVNKAEHDGAELKRFHDELDQF